MFPPSLSRSPYTDSLWGQRVEGVESPVDPREVRQSLREQPIISNSNMWQEKDLMGPMSHFSPAPTCNESSHPLYILAMVHIVDRTPRGGLGREGKNGGWYLHVPALWVGVKSDSTVSNSFSPRAARARQERPGWQMTPNICVMQPLQMRDSTSQSLCSYLSIEPSFSPPTTYTHRTTKKTDRPSVKIT